MGRQWQASSSDNGLAWSEATRAVVIVDLIVDVIELRTIDYVNDQVNDHDLPGRVGVADPLARQGEGLRCYTRKGETNSRFGLRNMFTFCVSVVMMVSCRWTSVGWALQSPTANGIRGRPLERPSHDSFAPHRSSRRSRPHRPTGRGPTHLRACYRRAAGASIVLESAAGTRAAVPSLPCHCPKRGTTRSAISSLGP